MAQGYDDETRDLIRKMTDVEVQEVLYLAFLFQMSTEDLLRSSMANELRQRIRARP